MTSRPALTRARHALAALGHHLHGLGLHHEVPHSYAQLLFSRSWLVGLLLLCATATSLRTLAGGLLGVLAASATARLLTLDGEARREGAFGYNALLCGLGLAHSFDGPAPLLLLVLVVAPAVTVLAAALRTTLTARLLPVLSWPFLITYALVLGLPAASGGLLTPRYVDPWLDVTVIDRLDARLAAVLPTAIDQYLRGLGALFFTPQPLAGALLLAALLLHSRIAALLATVGFAVAFALDKLLTLPPGTLVATLGYNTAFTAMALGGVWFVPALSSFLLAAFGALLCVIFVAGAGPPFARLGLPIMVLPFNLIVTLLLLALRQRSADRRPKSVDFLPGTPEENLSYFRTRLLRFRWLYAVRLALPFRGVWICTQGVDGSFTHKGRWRHGYDFEVRGQGGLLFHGDGSLAEHYHAYRLPVLAAAGGTVVKVVNHVPDNAIGAMNLNDNWGNLVLIHHAPGLYSLVAHLARGSVRVVEGQVVRQGDQLGLCGNSGRSTQPHLHFHLQASDRMGDGTVPCRFNDVVVLPKAAAAAALPLIETALSPQQGDELRNLDPSAEAAGFLAFPPGGEWLLRSSTGTAGTSRRASGSSAALLALHDAHGHDERLVSEVDLYGRRILRSPDREAALFYELGETFFTVFDVVGDSRSLLHLLRLALPRVPFEASEALRWRDHLPARPLRTFVQRVLGDFLSPFFHHDSIEVELRLQRVGQELRVTGESLRRGGGVPLLRTEAWLAPDGAPRLAYVTVRGRTVTIERTSRPQPAPLPEPPAAPAAGDAAATS